MLYILPVVIPSQITIPQAVVQLALNGKVKKPNPTPPKKLTDAQKRVCVSYLEDIDTILNGNNRQVNNLPDYLKYLDQDEPVKRGVVTKSIDLRIQQLKLDAQELYKYKRTGKNSWEGHQNYVKNQQEALNIALNNFRKSCEPLYILSDQEQKLKNKAKAGTRSPIPDKPDPKPDEIDKLVSKSKPYYERVKAILRKGKGYYDNGGRQQIEKILKDTGESATTIGQILLNIGIFFETQLLPQPQSQDVQNINPISLKNIEDDSQTAFKIKINSEKYYPLTLQINR